MTSLKKNSKFFYYILLQDKIHPFFDINLLLLQRFVNVSDAANQVFFLEFFHFS